MRAWLPALALFVFPPSLSAGGPSVGFMPILKGPPTAINQTSHYKGATAATHQTTFATLPKAGNTIVVAYYTWRSGAHTVNASGITDNNGNTYEIGCKRDYTYGTDRFSVGVFYAKNIKVTAGTFTVTITPTASSELSFRAVEYTGLDPVAPLDYGTSNTGSVSPVNSGSLNTTAAHTLLVGVVDLQTTGGQALTPTNSFSDLGTTNSGTNPMGGMATRIVTAKGSYAATWTLSPTSNWGSCIAAFK